MQHIRFAFFMIVLPSSKWDLQRLQVDTTQITQGKIQISKLNDTFLSLNDCFIACESP